MKQPQHRIRVQFAANRWRWRCHRGRRVCDLGNAPTQPQALAEGLTHLDLWHNDRRTSR